MPTRTNREEGQPCRQKSPRNRTWPLPGQDYTHGLNIKTGATDNTNGRIGETPCPRAKLDMEQHNGKKTMDKQDYKHGCFFCVFQYFSNDDSNNYDENLAGKTLGSRREAEDGTGQPGRNTDLTGNTPRLSL